MAVSTPVPDDLLEKHLTETRFDAHRELIRALTEGLQEEERQRQRDVNYLAIALIFLAFGFVAVALL